MQNTMGPLGEKIKNEGAGKNVQEKKRKLTEG